MRQLFGVAELHSIVTTMVSSPIMPAVRCESPVLIAERIALGMPRRFSMPVPTGG